MLNSGRRLVRRKKDPVEVLPTKTIGAKKTASKPVEPPKAKGNKKAVQSQSALTKLKAEDLVKERDAIKANTAIMAERLELINTELKIRVDSHGAKDDKGNKSWELTIDGNPRKLVLQARKKVSLNREKAEKLFKRLGIWDKVTSKVPATRVINEDYVQEAILKNELSMDDFESVTDINATYAFVIDPIKEEDYKHTKKE
jgi:hypothetical protein